MASKRQTARPEGAAEPAHEAPAAATAPPAAVARVLALQRSAGNSAVAGWLARSPLSDQITALASADKGRVFDALRARAGGADADALAVLQRRFATGTDDRWLAETLLLNGAEPLWPAALIEQRATLAGGHGWAAEAGNIAAHLPVPAGQASSAGVPPIEAYFFPGRTGDRALIVGGIHGSEPQGARVVESLRGELERMCSAGTPPHFSTILVPILHHRTHDAGAPAQGARNLPRAPGDSRAEANRTGIEPNRTFPRPGEDLSAATGRPALGRPEVEFDPPGGGAARAPRGDHATDTMPPETRALIALIERFRPSRIASVHAHSIGAGAAGRQGNDPGVFVDPRVVDPALGVDDPARYDPAGDQLGQAMLAEGRTRAAGIRGASGRNDPFRGNRGADVRYSPHAPHGEGYSLGDWAPVATGTRQGISTVTVEVPQYGKGSPMLQAVEDLHRDLLRDIFLGPPGTPGPAAAPPSQPSRPQN